MSISPRSGAWGLEILPHLKYHNLRKRENRLTERLNAAKNTDYWRLDTSVGLLVSWPYKVIPNILSYGI